MSRTIVLVIEDSEGEGSGFGGSRYKISLISPDGNMTFLRDHVPEVRKCVRAQVTKAFRKPRKSFKRDDE